MLRYIRGTPIFGNPQMLQQVTLCFAELEGGSRCQHAPREKPQTAKP